MKPVFTNKDKGYKLPFIGAMKDGETYETEAECLTRIKDMFDVDDVECFWNEERVPPGFQAGPIPGVDKTKDDSQSEEIGPGDKIVEDEIQLQESTPAVTNDPNPPKKGFQSDEPSAKDVSDSGNSSNDDDDSLSHDPDQVIIPSVDGSRSYDIGKAPNLSDLLAEFGRWPWDDGATSLLSKLEEETKEAMDGNSTPPSIDGNVVTVNGLSSASEIITVAIVAFKYMNEIHDITPQQMISLMVLRAQEQYDRYHNTQDKLDAEEPQSPSSPPSDESEEDN